MSGLAHFPSPPAALLNRPRLLERLDEGAPLTVLRAPDGYGKAALVAQWAAERAERFDERRWLQRCTDDDRAEIEAFLDAPRGVRRLLVAEVAGQTPIDAALLARMGRAASTRTILIAASSAVVPDHSIALAGGDLIGAESLAFTEEECGALLGDGGAARAAALHAATAGWPALVRVATARLGEGADPAARVAAYVDERVRELDAPTRALLEDGAVLGAFSGSDIAWLGGPTAARVDELAGWLENVGFLIRGGHDGATTWQVLPAIGRVVLAALARTEPERLDGLRRRAAELLLGRGDPAGALLQVVAASDWPRAVGILDEHWYRLLTERSEVIREVALRMPEEVIAHRPDLLFGRDIALAMTPSGALTSSLSVPPLADRAPRRPLPLGGDGTRAIVFALWRRLGRARRAGDYAQAMVIRAEMAEAIAEADPAVLARNRDLLPVLYLQWGVTSLLAGEDELARDDFRLSHESPAQGQGEFAHRISAADLGLLAAVAGDLPAARVWLEQAAAFAPLRGFFAKSGMYGEHVATALVAIESLDPDGARAALAITAKTVDRNEFWAFHLLAKARLAVIEHNELPVLTQLRALRRSRAAVAGESYQSARLLAVAEAELLLATGAAVRAGAVLAGAGDHPAVLATRATQLLSLGDAEAASAVAGAVVWAEHGGPTPRAIACLVRAAASLARGRDDDAVTAFRMGIGFAEEFGLRRVLGSVPRGSLARLAELAAIPLDLDRVPELYPEPTARAELTDRERLVLARLGEGLRLDEVASALFVSRNTLKTQLRSLYRKLGVHTMEDAIAEGQRQGFLDDSER